MEALKNLSDSLLNEAYEESKELNLEKDFIKLIEEEIQRRSLHKNSLH